MIKIAHQPNSNVVDFATHRQDFQNPALRFEVSSRLIQPHVDLIDYLKLYYIYLNPAQIDSVFGNCLFPSRLYGGRSYRLEHSLTERHVETLERNNIHLTLTLTNHYLDDATYRANQVLLKRHHRPGNSIVCVNDELANRIRNDYPDYTLKASLIKNLNSVDKVTRALELYHRAVLPMDKNDDDDFLTRLPEKERIVIFGNANCAYNCEARTCYAGISQNLWGKEVTSTCSKGWIPRPHNGHTFFDVAKFAAMGFRHIKLVPDVSPNIQQALEVVTATKAGKPTTYPGKARKQPDLVVHSYPKCGRTWLRTILGHYLNLLFGLEIPVNLQTIFTLLPNDGSILKGPTQFQFEHVDGLPLVLWSHRHASSATRAQTPHVLLVRSILDVVVSDYFHSQKLHGYGGTITEFVRDEQGGLANYCTYLNDWTAPEVPHPVAVLRYEALHENASEQVKVLLGALNLAVDEEHLKTAVDKASFSAMKDMEKAFGIAGLESSETNEEQHRVRKGRVNGYHDYLSAEDLAYIREQIPRRLSARALAFARQHDLLSNEL